jgi:hypothetical protein
MSESGSFKHYHPNYFHKIADGIEQSHLLSPVRHAFDRVNNPLIRIKSL